MNPVDPPPIHMRWILILVIIACVLFYVSFLTGCTTQTKLPDEQPTATIQTLKHDLWVRVNGEVFQGIGVAKRAKSYAVEVFPEEVVDRITWRTCGQEQIEDRIEKSFWDKLKGDNTYRFTMTPMLGLEDNSACGVLAIDVFHDRSKKIGQALIDFQDSRPEVQLPATVKCNGQTTVRNGVSTCQSAKGIIMQIVFAETAIASKNISGRCATLATKDERTYTFPLAQGECTYYFGVDRKDANGKRILHRLTTIGYTDAVYRGN